MQLLYPLDKRELGLRPFPVCADDRQAVQDVIRRGIARVAAE